MMMDQSSDVKLENLTQVSVHGSHLGQCEPLSDDVSDEPSSPESTTFDDSDLLSGGSCFSYILLFWYSNQHFNVITINLVFHFMLAWHIVNQSCT